MNIEFLNEEIGRIILAAVFGAILGFEREWKGKSAGFRTQMLVCVGAALFTEVSYHMSMLNDVSDATRIASNIVTGIGFLGAGLIFKNELTVYGLTTAATTWVSAAVGMAAGSGNYGLAAGTTILAWIILVMLQYLERRMQKFKDIRNYKITFGSFNIPALPSYRDYFTEDAVKLKESKMEKENGKLVLNVKIRASEKMHEDAIRKMLADDNVQNLDY